MSRLGGSRQLAAKIGPLIVANLCVFAVLSWLLPLGIWLAILAVIAFLSGVAFGKIGVIVSPVVAVAVGAHAELVARNPPALKPFIVGGVVVASLLSAFAICGRAIKIAISDSKGDKPGT
jgi:F0F1-type ATP synthase membrane subunit c/vacuolar-type H+-ATPase subunit K